MEGLDDGMKKYECNARMAKIGNNRYGGRVSMARPRNLSRCWSMKKMQKLKINYSLVKVDLHISDITIALTSIPKPCNSIKNFNFVGNESMADELRARTCIEMVRQRRSYESHACAENFFMLSPDFDLAIDDCARGREVCIWAMFALASVLRQDIHSIYPIMGKGNDVILATMYANVTLKPLDNGITEEDSLSILWTRVETDGPSPWRPTHFVPLISKAGTIIAPLYNELLSFYLMLKGNSCSLCSSFC